MNTSYTKPEPTGVLRILLLGHGLDMYLAALALLHRGHKLMMVSYKLLSHFAPSEHDIIYLTPNVMALIKRLGLCDEDIRNIRGLEIHKVSGGIAVFDTGNTYTGDLIITADGVQSKMRLYGGHLFSDGTGLHLPAASGPLQTKAASSNTPQVVSGVLWRWITDNGFTSVTRDTRTTRLRQIKDIIRPEREGLPQSRPSGEPPAWPGVVFGYNA
ncbi:hypothetical protein BJX65DRAFT_308982 [Aspergillus insuetus]